jgi:GNAT superfamily N-acetyltransferase
VLEDLWLEPEAIGTGHGRRLWEHTVEVARMRRLGDGVTTGAVMGCELSGV